MKRLVSMMLLVAMLVSCFGMTTIVINAADSGSVELLNADGTHNDYYSDITAAVAGINSDGMTVKVLQNCSITAKGANSIGSAYSYTLDGNNKTVTCNYTGAAAHFGAFAIWDTPADVVITIKNIILDVTGAHGVYQQGATVNYLNCNITTKANSRPTPLLGTPIYVGGDVSATSGSAIANIYSGKYESTGFSVALNSYKNSLVNVHGGHFYSAEHVAAICYGVAGALGNMNVFNGTLESGTSNALLVNAYGNVNVFGGSFIPGGTKSAMRNNKANASLWAYGTKYTTVLDVSAVAVSKPSLNTGAQVRLVKDSNGIRFISTVAPEVITQMKDTFKATDISYGTVIARGVDVAAVGSFTMGALKAGGYNYVDIPAKDGLYGNDTDGYTIRAALVNIKEVNEDVVFAAIPYVKATVNGEVVYYYGNYESENHSRSIREVAELALADVKDTSETGYANFVQDDGYASGAYNGKYSPYTQPQREVLYGYTFSK